MRLALIILVCGIGMGFVLNDPDKKETNKASSIKSANTIANFVVDYASLRYPGHDFSKFIYVGCKRQEMYYIIDTVVVAKYKISTSMYGIGNGLGTEKTPLGLHVIANKLGEEAPIGGIINTSGFTGETVEIENRPIALGTDDVTTRAMRLDGQEQGLNRGGNIDSYRRGIYIHGTPEEGLIGSPASHGCVRMFNKDVIDLFNRIEVGTPVIILNN